MGSDGLIEEAVARLDLTMSPSRIVLFGSRARKTHHPDSDADLPVAFDVVVATEDDLQRRGDGIGLVFRPALREGRVLLERGRAA